MHHTLKSIQNITKFCIRAKNGPFFVKSAVGSSRQQQHHFLDWRQSELPQVFYQPFSPGPYNSSSFSSIFCIILTSIVILLNYNCKNAITSGSYYRQPREKICRPDGMCNLPFFVPEVINFLLVGFVSKDLSRIAQPSQIIM